MKDEWADKYLMNFIQFITVGHRLKLFSTASYWHCRHSIEARVKRLRGEPDTVGLGYRR